jgi:hypothetical protein
MQKTLAKFVNVLDGQPSGTRGQSMVELALTAPMLILMIIAMAEVGFAANNFLILGDVVRSAGRQAVNMSVTTWPYGEARNFQRMDCNDTTLNPPQNQPGLYTLYGNTITVTDQRAIPRGSHLSGLGYGDSNEATKGFFDELACAITNGMSPLAFDDGITGASTVSNPNPKDDIVISVVNYRRMSLDNTLDLGGGTVGSLLSGSIASYGNAWVRVTGRWPLENRYCTSGGLGDNRDPFNYKTADVRTDWNDNDNGDEGTGDDVTSVPDRILTPGESQGVRGYVFTGRAVAPDGCYGSTFTVQDVEARLNIAGTTFNPKAANGAVVIIEIFWQHHPPVFGPIFQGFTGNRADDPVLHVWAWFPVPNAEPTPTPKP